MEVVDFFHFSRQDFKLSRFQDVELSGGGGGANKYTLFDGLAYNTCGYFVSCEQ